MMFNRVQSILPLYKTGWFYMIIALWCAIYWLISYYGLTVINDFQQNQLNHLFSVFGTETYFSVNDPKRLTQTYFLIYLPLLMNLMGLILIIRISQYSRVFQSLILSSYCLFLLSINYYFYTQSQWVEVVPSLVGLILTWLLMLFYQNENHLLQSISKQHNLLLMEAVSAFYQNQQFDKIMFHLNQTRADQLLVKHVYELVKQTENKNKALTKNLLEWLQNCGLQNPQLKHPGGEKKLALINSTQQKKQAKGVKSFFLKEDALDKTMVIKPGDEGDALTNQKIIPVDNFGRYTVEGLLGKGAMGIVYQGVDPKINRHVAIKTLVLNQDPDDVEFESRKKQFFREAQTAGNLNHPNIVTIYDVGEEGDLGYIAMDLLTGAPLSEYIKPETRLPTPLIYQLVIQITEALDYAHQNNVVHRDIKPGNIIFDDDQQKVTVTDFGIAFNVDNNKTHHNAIVGSPYYMSPEQIMGQAVDGRSDIFSLGVTLYQLLSGYLPFEGNSLASVSHQIINSKPISVADWDPELPASAVRITNRAMQKDVEKRYQSMSEFKIALISALKRDFKITYNK